MGTVGGLLFFFTLLNLFIGIYFLVQAIYLKKYLDRYLRMRLELSTAGTGTGFTVMDPIKRTTSILFINGAYLILCTLLKFWGFYELRLGVPSPERFLILWGAYLLLRSRSEYWHVSSKYDMKSLFGIYG